jgi:hypothetical protein
MRFLIPRTNCQLSDRPFHYPPVTNRIISSIGVTVFQAMMLESVTHHSGLFVTDHSSSNRENSLFGICQRVIFSANRTSRRLVKRPNYINTAIRTFENLSLRPRSNIGTNIIPRRDIIGGLVVLKSPLFFGSGDIPQIVHARIGRLLRARVNNPMNACGKNDKNKDYRNDFKKRLHLRMTDSDYGAVHDLVFLFQVNINSLEALYVACLNPSGPQ